MTTQKNVNKKNKLFIISLLAIFGCDGGNNVSVDFNLNDISSTKYEIYDGKVFFCDGWTDKEITFVRDTVAIHFKNIWNKKNNKPDFISLIVVNNNVVGVRPFEDGSLPHEIINIRPTGIGRVLYEAPRLQKIRRPWNKKCEIHENKLKNE